MIQIMPCLRPEDPTPLYIQLYQYIRDNILSGSIQGGEKLPSLRSLAKDLGISITTIGLAYDQLQVEGYISSRQGSGYFVSQVPSGSGFPGYPIRRGEDPFSEAENPYFFDPATFDFNKWKKCMNQVLTEHASLLFFEGDPQGEAALRREIAKYVYQSRGVVCQPSQIVIGAGTQQITGQLSIILRQLSVFRVVLEDPCYLPVKNSFRDRGFHLVQVPVDQTGIRIEDLPSGTPSAVYVNPSNQFPTGAVIPIGRRYELLAWASENNSIIIEDDYDSELRYFGRPIPALQGLDTDQRVVYLGSFSSTLYPSVKISYMILPDSMADIFQRQKSDYTQTCSKAEQLALALYMEKGQYQTGIRKLRSLCSQKLSMVSSLFARESAGFITPVNTNSGVNIILNIRTAKDPETLCRQGAQLGIHLERASRFTDKARLSEDNMVSLILYFNQIPLDQLPKALSRLIESWRNETSV